MAEDGSLNFNSSFHSESKINSDSLPDIAAGKDDILESVKNNSFDNGITTSSTPPNHSHLISATPVSKMPRLIFHTNPAAIQKMSAESPSKKSASLEEVKRYMPVSAEEKRSGLHWPLTGESGETMAANHYPYLTRLNNAEAEMFLNAHREQTSSNLSKLYISDRNSRNIAENEPTGESREMSPCKTDKAKKTTNHKDKLRKLLQQVLREAGSVVRNAGEYNMNITFNFNRVLRRRKRIASKRNWSLIRPKKNRRRRRKSKMSLNLQISL